MQNLAFPLQNKLKAQRLKYHIALWPSAPFGVSSACAEVTVQELKKKKKITVQPLSHVILWK